MTVSDDPNLEPATATNFDADRYVLANPDVAAFVRSGGDAGDHFRNFGVNEGRSQVVAGSAQDFAGQRLRKYARFRHVLDAAQGSGGAFRFARDADAFPVLYGTSSHDIDQYDRESANGGMGEFLVEVDRHPDRLYIDIGCGFRRATQANCLYLDVYPSASADIIMEPACTYPIASGSLDGIGCFAVLEHVTEPWIAAADFRRMLKPGGKLFIDWPFLQPVHGYPSHYYNATRAGLERMFSDGFDISYSGTMESQTPDHAASWLLRGWTDQLTDPVVRDEMLGMSVGDLIASPPGSAFWRRVLAATPPAVVAEYACGNVLIAQKR